MIQILSKTKSRNCFIMNFPTPCAILQTTGPQHTQNIPNVLFF